MKFAFGICLGGLIEAIIDGMVGWPKMVAIIVFGSLSVFFGLILGIRRLWPLGDRVAWNSGHIQRIGQTYELTLRKPRVIDKVRVLQGNAGQFNTPKKWKMVIVEDYEHWHEYEGNDFIEVSLDTPIKVMALSIAIVEPRLPDDKPKAKTWAFEDIKIREVRLFRRYWRKEVHAM